MKAQKVTVNITVEALSTDVVPALVKDAANRLQNEFTNGELVADDGDTVRWETKFKKVEF